MAKLEMAKKFIWRCDFFPFQYGKGFAIWISSGNVYYLAYFDINLAREISTGKHYFITDGKKYHLQIDILCYFKFCHKRKKSLQQSLVALICDMMRNVITKNLLAAAFIELLWLSLLHKNIQEKVS